MKVQKPRGQISHTGCQEKSLTECFSYDYVAESQVQELGCRKKKKKSRSVFHTFALDNRATKLATS